MSEFKRWYIGVYGGEAQARGCFPHTREIIRESEGATFALASELEASLAREATLQQRMTAADERVDVLEGFRVEVQAISENGKHRTMHTQQQMCRFLDVLRGKAAALKPAEGGGDDA